MDSEKILALLIEERDRLQKAIDALRGEVRGLGKRRGRPPKALYPQQNATKVFEKEKAKRQPLSAAIRKKMSAAQKKRWAEKKAGK